MSATATDRQVVGEYAPLADKFIRHGITVEVQADPKHWKLRTGSCVVGFWPTTGKCFAFGRSFRPAVDNLIKAMAAGRIRMPEDAGEAKCRSCGAAIWWVQTPKGKKMPLDRDGETHWATCPHADRHRKSAS